MKNGVKQTVIGEIPVDWEVAKLGETGRIVSGATPDTKVAEYWNGEIAWCTPTDITALKGKVYFSKTQKRISDLGLRNSSASLLPVGSLVICTRATLGDCAINLVPMATNQGFKSIVPNEDWDVNFLYYLINDSKEVIKRLSSGSTFLEISKKAFENIDIPFPPLLEQRKIAEILSTVDEKMALIDEQLAQTQELQKGLMQRLLTRGIGHTTFKDSPVGKIPASWEVVKMKDVCSKITDGTHFSPKPTAEGIPFITAIHVKDGFIDFESCKYLPQKVHDDIYKRCNPAKGDVLIVNIGAGTATPALVKVDFEFSLKNVALLKPNSQILRGDFLEFYQIFKKKHIVETLLSGGAQPFLSLKALADLVLLLPPLHEQRQITELLTTIDEKLQVLTQKKSQYQKLKLGLMQLLLTGQRRVRVAAELATLA